MEITMKTKLTTILIAIIVTMAASLSARQLSETGGSVTYNVNILDYSNCDCDYLPVQVTNSNLGISYGHSLSSRFQLNHAFQYNHHDKGFRGFFELGESDDVVLHSLNYSYKLNADYRLNNQWSVSGFISPQMRSNLEEESRNYYADVEGGTLFSYRTSDRLQVGGGIAYTRTLGEKLIHPVLYASYDNQNNFRAVIYFPEYANVWFNPGKRFGFGMEASLKGDEFTGRETVFGGNKTSIQYADFTVGPAAEMRISDFLTFSMKAAYTAGRHLVIESASGRDRLKPSPVWGLSAGIQLRIF
jgi:hypothetical protein